MDVTPYSVEDVKENNKDKSMRKSDFGKAVFLIVWTLRFLGCLPDFRTPSTPLRIMFMLYSGLVFLGNCYFFTKFFNKEPMDNYGEMLVQLNFTTKSHEKFYLYAATYANFIYTVVIQILYWICAKNIYQHLNDWIKFERLYYDLTNEDLLPPLKRKAVIYHLFVTVTIILSAAAQQYQSFNVQVRPELALFFFALLRYTDVMFLMLMKAGSLSASQLSKLYMEEFNNLKETPRWPARNRLAQYEALWLKLSELIRGTGNAMAYVMFLHIIRYVVLGLFFSYIFWVRLLVLLQEAALLILLSWLIEISITYYCIWLTTTSAYDTELQMSDLLEKLRHQLNENENNPKFNFNLVEQVTSFQETVNVLQPKVTLLDYFSVDRNLLFVIVELHLTYLVILVQFKIAEYSIKGSKN